MRSSPLFMAERLIALYDFGSMLDDFKHSKTSVFLILYQKKHELSSSHNLESYKNEHNHFLLTAIINLNFFLT